MNGNTQKLVAYVALVFIAAALLCVWGAFAFYGKTDVGAFISKLGDLLGIVVAAITALGTAHVYTSRVKDQAPVQPPAVPASIVLPTEVK